MGLTTTKYALPYPVLADGPDGADVPYWIQHLAEALDVKIASYDQGAIGSRPVSTGGSPGKSGRFYLDTGATPKVLYLDYGTGWLPVGSAPPWGTADYSDASVTDAKIVGMDGSKLVALSVPTGALADKLVTAAKIADNLKPSVTAGAATEALRALGTAAGTAMAGNQAAGGDLTGTLPNPTIATLAITASKIALATITDAQVAVANKDGAAGTPSLRTLGAGSAQAAAGNDARFTKTYRRTAARTINNSNAEFDLLNGSLDLAANDLGTDRLLRLIAHGDLLQNTGAARIMPQFKYKLGGTTLIDTGSPAVNPWATSASRFGWQIEVLIQQLGVGVQRVSFALRCALLQAQAVGVDGTPFVTGDGAWGPSGAPSGSSKQSVLHAVGGNAGALDATTALAQVLSVIPGGSNVQYEVSLKGAHAVIL